jgi:ligand-binding sensor domain-containing protein
VEGKVIRRVRTPALGLAALAIAAGGLCACREVIEYDDVLPPGADAPIAWEPTGPAGEGILALRIDQAGVLYAGSESGKLFRSVTDGDEWSPVILPHGDGAVTSIVPDPLGRLFVTNDVHGVYLSIDGGVTWSQANAGLTDTSIYAMTYVAGGTLLVGSARGRVSGISPGGTVWTERFSIARPVTFLQAVSSQEVFAASWGSGIIRFGPSDSTAVTLNAGLQDLFVNVVYPGPGGYLFAGTRSAGVYRSDPGSIFWQNAGGGSISREVIALRATSYGELFAGTATGVFVSTDQGIHWTHLTGGIGAQEVRALAAGDGGRVFAGTAGGVYRSVRTE